MRLSISLFFGLVCVAATVAAAPQFDDYRVPVSAARLAHVQLTDPHSRQYATMLRSAKGKRPNFAGHFVLVSWGCGASCLMAAAIDTRTGAVDWLPFTVCCWAPEVTEPLQFRPDSSLLIVHGSRNEQGDGVHQYTFGAPRFTEISE